MRLPSHYKRHLAQQVASAARAIAGNATADNAAAGIDAGKVLEYPREDGHGDLSCPLPMMLAKRLRQSPLKIAENIAGELTQRGLPAFIADMKIAPPGFINFTIGAAAKLRIIDEVMARAENYGAHPPRNESILLEYISANPTGPLHVGHGRACAYGDALANILQAAGADVRREYYVNDAGRQIDILAASAWLRYWLEKNGGGGGDGNDGNDENNGAVEMPDGAYRGDYLADAARALADLLNDTAPPPSGFLASDEMQAGGDAASDHLIAAAKAAAAAAAETFARLRRGISDFILDEVIKNDMRALGVDVDNISFYAETTLHAENKVEAVIAQLEARGALMQKDGAVWFKSSEYQDEKDRVVRRANGQLTYFAADIAYHADKLSRPRPPENRYTIINVLGADHHGYVPRLSAAIQALGFEARAMETEIIQFVALYENGERLKMSTRAGEFITLRELVGAVKVDAARYYYLNRKNDQHLDFDLTAARARERKNPIFYLQYATARVSQVIKKWQDEFNGDERLLDARAAALACERLAADDNAARLCAMLMQYPEIVLRAANERAPHLMTVYLHTLAGGVHNFYEQTRILPQAKQEAQGGAPAAAETSEEFRRACLALLFAARVVLRNGGKLLGLTMPDKMPDKMQDIVE